MIRAMTVRELIAALQRLPDRCLDRPVIAETGLHTTDRPVTGLAETGPWAGALILTTRLPS
jgi:hypothetical protein